MTNSDGVVSQEFVSFWRLSTNVSPDSAEFGRTGDSDEFRYTAIQSLREKLHSHVVTNHRLNSNGWPPKRSLHVDEAGSIADRNSCICNQAVERPEFDGVIITGGRDRVCRRTEINRSDRSAMSGGTRGA